MSIIQGYPLKKIIENKTFGEFLFESYKKHATNIAQIDANLNQSETYENLNLRSIRLALSLIELGLKSEDVIISCSGNNLDCTVTVTGTCYLGAKIANLDPTLSQRQINHLINLVQPKIVFVEDYAVELIEEAIKTININAKIIVYGTKSKNHILFSDLIKKHDGETNFQPVKVDLDGTAVMFFSSGSTGLPKAICHSHKSFIHIILSWSETGLESKSLLYFSTYYWISAVMFLGTISYRGGTRIMSRPIEAETVFQIIEQYKIEAVFFAPVLIYQLTLFENSKKYNTSSLTEIYTGGTKINPSQFNKLSEILPTAKTIYVYGLTEIGLACTFHKIKNEKFIRTKIGSCGFPGPGVNAKIVDVESRQILGPNQSGEICLQSKSLMIGYYYKDSSDVFDKDGFFLTGDIGYYDKDNCFYVVDRIKEMFKYLSWHIVPSLLESILHEHPSISQAIVFGTPLKEEELGEVPTAYVVLKPNCHVTEKEIEDFVCERVSDREKLRGGVVLCEDLLKTPTGKINKKEIRENHLKKLKGQQ